MFKLGDSLDYTYMFIIYTVKNRDCTASTDEVVNKTMSPYLHCGGLLVDECYTSVTLAEQMLKKNLHFGNCS